MVPVTTLVAAQGKPVIAAERNSAGEVKSPAEASRCTIAALNKVMNLDRFDLA